MDKKKQFILYGLSGAEMQYRALRFFVIYDESPSIHYIKYIAREMVEINPSIERVYVIDNRNGLKRDYMESYMKNSIESCAIFKDILERDGIRII